MSTAARYNGDVQVLGRLSVTGGVVGVTRSSFTSDVVLVPIPLTSFRVWDAYQTLLGTPASDDLGIATGTFATGLPYISTGDVKAAGSVTRYARCLLTLPPEYVTGSTLSLIFEAGMITTVADGTATIDAQAYLLGSNTLITGSDLVSTAAQSINSLTFADFTFVVTPTNLQPGSVLDVRIAIATADASTVTAVIGALSTAFIQTNFQG